VVTPEAEDPLAGGGKKRVQTRAVQTLFSRASARMLFCILILQGSTMTGTIKEELKSGSYLLVKRAQRGKRCVWPIPGRLPRGVLEKGTGQPSANTWRRHTGVS
jgi:hypothetical protein